MAVMSGGSVKGTSSTGSPNGVATTPTLDIFHLQFHSLMSEPQRAASADVTAPIGEQVEMQLDGR